MGHSFSAATPRVDSKSAGDLRFMNDDFIEAEIALKNLHLAQKRAYKLIERQERFAWEFLGASSVVIVLIVAGAVAKRKDFAIPIVPLVMGIGYRYDYAYGRKLETIKDDAENLLKENDPRLKAVGGLLTLKEVDAYRERHFNTEL